MEQAFATLRHPRCNEPGNTYANLLSEHENPELQEEWEITEEKKESAHGGIEISDIFPAPTLPSNSEAEKVSRTRNKNRSRHLGITPSTTPYWDSLRCNKAVKRCLISAYEKILRERGDTLGRDGATKRLRQRCDEKVAAQLLSDNLEEQEAAFNTLKGLVQYAFDVCPLDRHLLYVELTDRFCYRPKEASDLINLRFKNLTSEKKEIFHGLSVRDDEEVHQIVGAALSALEYETAARDRASFFSVNRDKSKEKQQKQSGPGYTTPDWDSLNELSKRELLEKYMILTRCEIKCARNRLSRKEVKDIFQAILSSDTERQRDALRKLDLRGGSDDEILTITEKKELGQYLQLLHGIRDTYKNRVCSMGLKYLNDEDREKIVKIDEKNPQTYCWLADAVYSVYKTRIKAYSKYYKDRKEAVSAGVLQ